MTTVIPISRGRWAAVIVEGSRTTLLEIFETRVQALAYLETRGA